VSTPPGPEAVLEVVDVSVRFGGIVALDGVSLEVAPGEIVGVIGPNGAGKTTLFDVISGIRPPDAGAISLGGTDVSRRGAPWRARHGMRRTFQRQQVFGTLSVEDNLLVAQEWSGGSGGIVCDLLGVNLGRRLARQRRERVERALELCGLIGIRRTIAAHLPIGQARLVELGRAIVDSPQVLLLDEPSSGLGEAEQGLLSDAIHRIQDSGRCGVLLIEHDVAFVMEHCDRIVVLNLGAKIAEGTPADVQNDVAVRTAYLG
jgi:branched-chain amino acid transport system ATP-binding protein